MTQTHRPARVYDMIVIGGGPGGYTAAIYAATAGLAALVLERRGAGGQMALTQRIENYPGFEEGIDGFSLGEKMKRQAERLGAETQAAEVIGVELAAVPRRIDTSRGPFWAKTVVIASGADPRPLGVEGEKEWTGRGVAYCAACDGMFYRGKTVAVVGGGNSAVEEVLLLSRVADRVILIHRRDSLRAAKSYQQRLREADNVAFCWNSQVVELLHDDKLNGLRLKNVATGEESTLACEGVFVSVGRIPATEFLGGAISLDSQGYVVAGEDTGTNLPGVYAVGDVRTKALRQIVTAVADGAAAVHRAEEYLAALL